MAKTPASAPAKTKRPKPPKIVRVAYRVERDAVVELDGKRHHLYASSPTRIARPLVVDSATWDKLKADPMVADLLARGAAREVL